MVERVPLQACLRLSFPGSRTFGAGWKFGRWAESNLAPSCLLQTWLHHRKAPIWHLLMACMILTFVNGLHDLDVTAMKGYETCVGSA